MLPKNGLPFGKPAATSAQSIAAGFLCLNRPTPSIITENPHKSFNVFYIPQALNSPYIPAQDEFVIPHKIKSVLGFGGMLPSGDLFAVILFSKMFIPLETAERFKWLSAYIRIAIEEYGRERTFKV